MFQVMRKGDSTAFPIEGELIAKAEQQAVANQHAAKFERVFRFACNVITATFVCMLFVEPSFAGAGGGTFQSVTTGVNTLVTIMKAIAIGAGTIAILWAGFKVLFGGASFREIAPIIIGGMLVSGASGLGALLFTPD